MQRVRWGLEDLILLFNIIPPTQLSWCLSDNSVKTQCILSFDQPKDDKKFQKQEYKKKS